MPPFNPDRKLTRRQIEERAVEYARSAVEDGKQARGQCSPAAVYALARANRDIGLARSRLSGLGHADSKRTMRLWGVVERATRFVDESANHVARCLVRR